MSDIRLVIKHLSRTGELLNCVNCFSGQVTVLRSHSQKELRAYKGALFGRGGPEKFSININTSPFRSDDAAFVGAGNSSEIYDSENVGQVFEKLGMHGAGLESILNSIGLSQKIHAPISSLTACESRRLELTSALIAPQTVIILDRPFEPLASQWRTRFADLILRNVRKKNRICVVSELTFRPETWIGNEQIVRIQVGESIQKTIGFASEGDSAQLAIEQLRSLVRDDKTVQYILDRNKKPKSPPVQQTNEVNTSEIPEKLDSKPTTSQAPVTSASMLPDWEDSTSGKEGEDKEASVFSWASLSSQLPLRKLASFPVVLLALLVILLVTKDSGDPTLGQPQQKIVKVEEIESSVPPEPIKSKVKFPFSANKPPNSFQRPTDSRPQINKSSPRTIKSYASNDKIVKDGTILGDYPSFVRASLLKAMDSKSKPSYSASIARAKSQNSTPSEPEEGALDALRHLKGSPSSSTPTDTAKIFRSNSSDNPDWLGGKREEMVERQRELREKLMSAISDAVERKSSASNPPAGLGFGG